MDGDPVGSTGPRMLEKALHEWQAVHSEGSLALHVVPPDAFFPLWDKMQEDTFKERCDGDVYAQNEEILAAGLGDAVVATCGRLRRERFLPTVPEDGSAFTAHHWAHSWVGAFADQFADDNDHDVLMLNQVADPPQR